MQPATPSWEALLADSDSEEEEEEEEEEEVEEEEEEGERREREEKMIQQVIGIAICPLGNNSKFEECEENCDSVVCVGADLFSDRDCGGGWYRCVEGTGAHGCCHNHLLDCGTWLGKMDGRTYDDTLDTMWKFCSSNYDASRYYADRSKGEMVIFKNWKKNIERLLRKFNGSGVRHMSGVGRGAIVRARSNRSDYSDAVPTRKSRQSRPVTTYSSSSGDSSEGYSDDSSNDSDDYDDYKPGARKSLARRKGTKARKRLNFSPPNSSSDDDEKVAEKPADGCVIS